MANIVCEMRHCPVCSTVTYVAKEHEGVTPMWVSCRRLTGAECGGQTTSAPRLVEIAEQHVEWEWYKPAPNEYKGFTRDTLEHLRMGGLLLRKISIQPTLAPPPVEKKQTFFPMKVKRRKK